MLLRWLWLVALLTSTIVSTSAERLPSFSKKTDYDEARESLIALGWRPVSQSSKRCDIDGCFDRCAPGFEQRCRAYPEAVICRGTGLAACEFLWRRGETCRSGEAAPSTPRRTTLI